jgi:hypothetical protein
LNFALNLLLIFVWFLPPGAFQFRVFALQEDACPYNTSGASEMIFM